MSSSQLENPVTHSLPKVVIAATFTAEPLAPALTFALEKSGMPVDLVFAGYQQVFQELSAPHSSFARNSGGVNLLLVRPVDFVRFHGGSEAEKDAAVTAAVAEFAAAAGAFAARSAVPLLVALCPSSQKCGAETAACTLLEETPGVHCIADGALPAADGFDPIAEASGHIPYTAEYFSALALALGGRIHALLAPPHKVIALDADETLWRGICGEIGPAAVELDASRHALQQFMRARKEEGFLLAICSKNSETDVRAAFEAHPAWPLRFEDFAAHRINWQSKSASLRELATELGLSTTSFIFLDDNPLECAEVRSQLPDVAVLELPLTPEKVEPFLQAAWIFQPASVTAEDRHRSEFYAQNRERETVRTQAATFGDFIASLELQIEIEPLAEEDLERAAQLTVRTNQFNATLLRRTAPELRQQHATRYLRVQVRDRFGDYGFVGLLGFAGRGADLIVEQFLLSCRVLGRGVEHAMMRRLLAAAQEYGCTRVVVPFQSGPRNLPVRQFLEEVAEAAEGGAFQLASTAECAWSASSPSPSPVGATAPAAMATPSGKPDWTALARLFSHPAELHAALAESHKNSRPELAHAFVAPGTEMERAVALIWADVLHVEHVGARDNFFELGGQSIQLVTVHRRLVERGHGSLAIASLFEHPTVADLAAHLTSRSVTNVAALSGQSRGARQRLALAARK
jgi:FkbH-like protein